MCDLIITSLKSVNFNQNKKTLAILMMINWILINWSSSETLNRCLRTRGHQEMRGAGDGHWIITNYFQTITDKLFISCRVDQRWQPIRGQYPGHVIILNQSEARRASHPGTYSLLFLAVITSLIVQTGGHSEFHVSIWILNAFLKTED